MPVMPFCLFCAAMASCPLCSGPESTNEMGSSDHSAVCRMSDKPKCTDSMSFYSRCVAISSCKTGG